MEMGYLTVLYVRFLGAKIGDLHAKDYHLFRNGQIKIERREKRNLQLSALGSAQPRNTVQQLGLGLESAA